MGEDLLGGEEGLIQDQLKSQPFPGGILAEAISMTHSGMLYRLDISRFYFYEPLPWLILENKGMHAV